MRRSDIPLLEDDPMLFEPPPEWLLPEGKRALRTLPADDGLGLRSLADDAEFLPRRAGRRRRAGYAA